MKQPYKKFIDRLHFIIFMFFISATLMLIVTLMVSFYINRMEKAVEESTQKHLLAAAMAASNFLTVEELDLFHTGEDMKRPEWEEIRARLQQFAEDYQVLYVYYWRYTRDGQIQYIIDNDEDEEWMVTPELFFDLDEDPVTAEAVPFIIAGNTWVSDLGTYTTSWDSLISGLAPVFNADGSVYCAAGVDLSDEIILIQRTNIRIMRIVLFVSLILSVLSGCFGIWLYRRKALQSENISIAKSNFLSIMSHEIRTPLNAIIGIAQIELQKEDLPEKHAIAMEKIYSSGGSLLGIINDILDLSKIETGKLEITPREYDVPSFINDTAQINMVRIGSKEINFMVEADRNLPSIIYGDELRTKQILNNLLSNAIKYTNKGHVKLFISHTKEGEDLQLRFSVEDTGIGLKQEELDKLFLDYQRFNLSANRETEGTGLGLPITKKLIELMDGKIEIKSEYEKGSTFTVTLKQKAIDCIPIGDEVSKNLRNFNFSNEKYRLKLQLSHEPMPYGKVLIVDDMETNLYIAQEILSYYKLDIETATSGFKTLDLVKSGKTYDIIFMDHMMPVMDGVETTQKLRSLGYKNTILALTANAMAGSKEMFIQHGFDGFIPKPIDIKDMDLVVKVYIRDKHQEK
ncbi:MAG: response regulator [Treponema sp.]|jgi:CheY-like chemotaxis protein/anti-sigma regulatory factor (Ser/Thr protein kinase)|nr:response regulator [Treponema sp.]